MRELFVLDKKNYNPNGTVGRRPSVRGIIIRDGKIAMMHSKKYNYYKLPGGGIEPQETLEDTLIREVREESGLIVKPETIKEFGYVRRIEKGRFEDIFVQDNYYFLCEAEAVVMEQELEEYEAEEQFVLEFVSITDAISVNESANHFGKEEIVTFRGMLDRENRVLELLKDELNMNIVTFNSDLQKQVDCFFEKCFSAVSIPYSPKDRHADVANVEQYYMDNGCFWCLMDDDKIIGTIAIRMIDNVNMIVELKRMFVLPEYQGKGYGRLLLEHAVKYARTQQYQKICLDTRKQFSVAQHLYRSVGFQETDRYNDNEHAELYFELVL